jgi:hypothetical protein
MVSVVVAAQVIPARTPIQPGALVVREIPLDAATQVGIVTDPKQLAGKVRFLKIFRQGNRELATRLGVTGSPTVLFFKGGKEVGARMTGEEIKRSALKAAAEQLLG